MDMNPSAKPASRMTEWRAILEHHFKAVGIWESESYRIIHFIAKQRAEVN